MEMFTENSVDNKFEMNENIRCVFFDRKNLCRQKKLKIFIKNLGDSFTSVEYKKHSRK